MLWLKHTAGTPEKLSLSIWPTIEWVQSDPYGQSVPIWEKQSPSKAIRNVGSSKDQTLKFQWAVQHHGKMYRNELRHNKELALWLLR